MASCASGSVTCWITQQADILNNIAAQLGPVQQLIFASAYVIGIFFALKAVFSLKQYGESRTMMSSHTNIKEPLVLFLVAAAFMYFPSTLKMMMESTFGYASVLQYTATDSPNQNIAALFGPESPVGRALTIFIQTIGLIAFVRGWILISRSASQGQPPGGTGKGLMHIFGGVLAVNIVGTLEIINNTLYGT